MWIRREFDPARDEQFFSELPAAPAVFVLRPLVSGAEPYVSKTSNLRKRIERLLGTPKATDPHLLNTADVGHPVVSSSRRLNLRERVSSVEWQPVGGDFEAGFALYQRLRMEFPRSYADRLHLRPAPLLHLIRENAYPRLTVTSRIRSLRSGNTYFGPFASRAEAEQYADSSLDFFLLRRCTQELNPDPAFPGCVYSEMKMCLAPCFQGCTDQRYAEEVERVQQYLESHGRSMLVQLGRARDEASAQLEFEAAAAAHARLEKVKALQGRISELVHRIDQLNGILLQPSHLTDHIALFRITGGMLSGPIQFNVSARRAPAAGAASVAAYPPPSSNEEPPQTQSPQSQSMEARIQQTLRAAEAATPGSAQEWMEHLALIKRWYYRSNKVGEVFFEDEHGALPMRRLVRAVGRVLKGEKPAEDLSETAGDYWIYRGKEAGLR